jgi:ABC-type amino acid transport substrate-binding protein
MYALRRLLAYSSIAMLHAWAVSGCGLVIDAVQLVLPAPAHELQAICARQQLRVGMAIEPRQPFVFPAIWTDEGSRVTGLDVELIREIITALSKECETRSVSPALRLVHFRDLFVELNEGKLDLFVSAVAANVPLRTRAGLAYSMPYFYNGGLTGITKQSTIAARIRGRVGRSPEQLIDAKTARAALAGMTVAVQEGTSAHLYADANLLDSRVVLCDSLPAAFESADPPIDVILGKEPVLTFTVTRARRDWQRLEADPGRPYLLTREHYVIVMAEENYRLRAFINDVLIQLDASGRLAELRRRWLSEVYAFPRRAAAEGLPFAVEKMVSQQYQGECRWGAGR